MMDHRDVMTWKRLSHDLMTRSLWEESTGHMWIPLTTGQWCGALMNSFNVSLNTFWTNSPLAVFWDGWAPVWRHYNNHAHLPFIIIAKCDQATTFKMADDISRDLSSAHLELNMKAKWNLPWLLSVKTTNNQNCALPFVYRGNTYTTCTTVGNSGNPWCSLDTNYNGRWGQCDLSTCTPVGTTAPPTQPPGACIRKYSFTCDQEHHVQPDTAAPMTMTSWHRSASALLALCEGNPPVDPHHKVLVMQSLHFAISLKKVEQAVEFSVIWDVMILTWRHCTSCNASSQDVLSIASISLQKKQQTVKTALYPSRTMASGTQHV